MRKLASVTILALVCACSEPPPPAKTCTSRSDCGAKQYCSGSVCVTDEEAPKVTITSPVADSVVTTPSVELEGTVTDNSGTPVASLEYSLDGRTFTALAIGDAFSKQVELAQTQQAVATIIVRATDAAGNTGAASVAFNLDFRTPIVTISSPVPSSYVNSATTKLEGTVTDPSGSGLVSLEYSLDGSTFEKLDTDLSFSKEVDLPEVDATDVTVTVRASNAAGFVGSSSVKFVVDRIKPKLELTPPAKSLYNFADLGTSIDVRVTATDAGDIATLEWSLDGKIWKAFAAPSAPVASHVVTEEDDGVDLVFQVRATDRAGNPSNAATEPVSVDAARPVVRFTSPAPGAVFTTSAAIAVAGKATDKKLESVSATLDGAPLDLTRSGEDFSASISPTDQRDYALVVTAADEAGNTREECVTIAVDDPPVITVTSPKDGTVFNLASPASVTFSGSIADATKTTLSYTLDGAAPVDVDVDVGTGAFSFPLLLATEDETPHEVVLTATDFHLQATKSKPIKFVTDRVAPVITLAVPTEGQIFNLAAPSPMQAKGTIEDKHFGSATWKLDGGADQPLFVQPSDSTFSFPSALSATDDYVAHRVVIEAVDAAGNASTLPARNFVVDRVPPKVAFTAPSQNAACTATCSPLEAVASIAKPSIHFAGTSSDGGPSVSLSLNFGGSPMPLQGAYTSWAFDWVSPVEDATSHSVVVLATDAAGNSSSSSRDVWVDKVAPTMTMLQAGKRLVPRMASLVSFSERMNPATVSAAAIFAPTGPTLVDSGTEQKIFRASNGSLSPYTVYTLTIGTGAADLAGNPIAAGTESFMTETVMPPTGVAIHAPASTPRMAIDADGNPYLAYWDATAKRFLLSSWNGNTWTTNHFRQPPSTTHSRAVYQIEAIGAAPADLVALEPNVRILFDESTSYGPGVQFTHSSLLTPISWSGFTAVEGTYGAPMTPLLGQPSFRTESAYTVVSFTTDALKTTSRRFSGDTYFDSKVDYDFSSSGKAPHGVRGVGLARAGSAPPETDAFAVYTPAGYGVSAIDASRGGVAIAGAPQSGGPAAWLVWSNMVQVNMPPFGLVDRTVLTLACSTNPDAGGPNWKVSSGQLPTAVSGSVVSALDIAATPSGVGIAMESSATATLAFGFLPNVCPPSAAPFWEVGYDDAKEPTVAVGPDGKLWKAYVKASTGELLLAP